jgi:hypothetical protein
MTVQLSTRPPSRSACRDDLPAFGDRPKQPAIFDTGRSHPGIDAQLDPDRNRHGPDAPALALKVGRSVGNDQQVLGLLAGQPVS